MTFSSSASSSRSSSRSGSSLPPRSRSSTRRPSLASASGALIFGRVADILGRKRIYGDEVLILAFGAIASAWRPTTSGSCSCPASSSASASAAITRSRATIMSEYSGKKTRWRMVGLVFAMQGAGLVARPSLIAPSCSPRPPSESDLADPAGPRGRPGPGGVLFCGARSTRHHGFAAAWRRSRRGFAGGDRGGDRPSTSSARGRRVDARHSAGARLSTATSGSSPEPANARTGHRDRLAWLMFDFAYYGNTISSPEVLKVSTRTPVCSRTPGSSCSSSRCSRCPATRWRSAASTGTAGRRSSS